MSNFLLQNPEMQVISKRFQELLDREGITQDSFSKKLGLSRGHLSKVLTQKALPSGVMLIKLANAGYDVMWLLSGKESGLANWEKEKELLEYHIDRLEKILFKPQK